MATRNRTLTTRTIEALKPGATRREIPEGAIRGLYLVSSRAARSRGRIATDTPAGRTR